MKTDLKILMLAMCLAVACSEDNDTKTKTSVETVEIELLEASAGTENEEIEIHVRTAPHNGCWRDIEVQLAQDDSRHFTLKAKGTFIQYADGSCTDNLVQEDTVIRFAPVITGKHFFKANSDPFTVLRDTVNVE